MVLLDFGQCKALSAERQAALSRLVIAMDQGWPAGIVRAMKVTRNLSWGVTSGDHCWAIAGNVCEDVSGLDWDCVSIGIGWEVGQCGLSTCPCLLGYSLIRPGQWYAQATATSHAIIRQVGKCVSFASTECRACLLPCSVSVALHHVGHGTGVQVCVWGPC